MLLIPAIDLRAGRCVRLYQGRFDAETRYTQDPLTILAGYRDLGARWVHVVDLDGARSGAPVNGPTIANLARQDGVRLQVGGGVRSAHVIEALLDAGVGRVVIGSLGVQQPVVVLGWLKRFGPERLCLAFDVRMDEFGRPRVYTNGWTREHGVVLWDVLTLFPGHCLRHVLCTDIARDGTLTGPNLELYRSALKRFPEVAWQASGGVRDARDLDALARLGVAAAVSGKALLENRIPPDELAPYLPAGTEGAGPGAQAVRA